MNKFSNKYLIILGAFLIELTLGHLYTSGYLQNDIIDFMNKNSYSTGSVNKINSAWIFGTISLGTGASLSLGGYLELKFGTWKTVLIGSWFMSLNFGLMYFTLKSYLSVVIITFGLFGGIGVGLAYAVSLSAAGKCFNKNRGIIFGITISGFGLSAAFSDTFHFMIKTNPKIKFQEYFLIMSSIYIVIQSFGVFLLRRKPAELLIESEEFPVTYLSSNSDKYDNMFSESSRQFKPHQLIFEYDFWNLWFLLLLNSADDNLIASLYNTYMGDNHISHLTIISIITSIFNCLGRIFWGYLFDKIQFKKIMIVMTLTNAIFIGTIPTLNYLHPSTRMYFSTVWFSIINFLIGGYFAIFPSICAKLFGMKYFVCNYGMIFTSCSVSSTIVSIVLINTRDPIGVAVFIIGGVLSLLATLIAIGFRGRSLIFHEK